MRNIYTNAIKNLEKLSNKNLALLLSSYFPFLLMFYGITLNNYSI